MNKKSTIESSGLKATANRLSVLEILHNNDSPLSAREVWQQLPAVKIGFATVYRTLSALCSAGLARKILSENNALYESSRNDTMPQLICSRCGKVEEIKDPNILRYNNSIMKQRQLEEHHSLLLYADCRKKECDEQ
ncbi:MAG: transcriptional repressor [Proteobacteria bacterium]|nr:transcriptional repressor [Pseudomonadota bacterium]MCH9757521.1 transcriptional repressor [Pseudomonadota bacterium]